ncbi:MAG: hypothetical protein QJR03_09280 [Sphaerobacter sp.]|nr:hypothetical protein [Sphaerobacter sp.]
MAKMSIGKARRKSAIREDVGPAPEEAGREANERAQTERDGRAEQPDEQGDPRPVHDPGKLIAAQFVGPQPVLPRGRVQAPQQALLVGVVARDDRRQRGRGHHDDQVDRADQREAVAAQLSPDAPLPTRAQRCESLGAAAGLRARQALLLR